MNLDILKQYAHCLDKIGGDNEITRSKAWYLYRCQLVEFLFEFKEHFVQKEIKQILKNLNYHPVSYWAAKFKISRALMYRDVLPLGHVIEFERGVKYATFEIGYTYVRKNRSQFVAFDKNQF